MKNQRRKKLVKQDLENALMKVERRIQKLAENAYHIRQALEEMNKIEREVENAIHTAG